MKGSLQDMIFVGVILLATSITVMVSYLILQEFFSTAPLAANPVTAAMGNTGLDTLVILGNSFIFIFFSFGIAAAISAFYTETHPIFFIFSILVFAVCVMVMAIFSDVFVELASTGVLLPVAAEFVLMVETMANLKTLAIVLGAIIILALYAKRSDVQVGGGIA